MESRVGSHSSAGPSGRMLAATHPRRLPADYTNRRSANWLGIWNSSNPAPSPQPRPHTIARCSGMVPLPAVPLRRPPGRSRLRPAVPLPTRPKVNSSSCIATAAGSRTPDLAVPPPADGASDGSVADRFPVVAVPNGATAGVLVPTIIGVVSSSTPHDATLVASPPSSPPLPTSVPSCPPGEFINLGEGFILHLCAVAQDAAHNAAGAETAAIAQAGAGLSAGTLSEATPGAASAAVAAAAVAVVAAPQATSAMRVTGPAAPAPATTTTLGAPGPTLIPSSKPPSNFVSAPKPHPAVDPRLEARKELTRRIRSAVTWRELRELLAAAATTTTKADASNVGVAGDLDELHLLTAARRLRALAPQSGRRVAREQALFRTFVAGFTALCGRYLTVMGAVPLAGVLYALSSLRFPPPAHWISTWLSAAEARLRSGHFGPRELANSTYALGQLGFDPGISWLELLCSCAAAYLTPPAAAAAAAAVGDAAIALEDRGECLAAAAASDKAGDGGGGDGSATVRFTAHGMSQMLWGLARLQYTPAAPTMRALCDEVRHQLPDFTAAGLANALWGVTTLSYRPPDRWVRSVAATCLQLMPTCSSYDLSVSTWALLRLGFTPDRDWLAGFLSASYCQLPSASPEHAARLLWGLAKLGLTPPRDWLRRWLSLTYVRLLEAKSMSLTTMMWALATLGIRPGIKWVDLLLVAAWEAPLRAFSAPDLVMLLWGLAKCGTVPEEAWMEEFWSVSYKRLPVLTARHLALVLYSCVTLGQAPSGRWLAGHEGVTAARMDEQTSEGLSLLSYSYGMLERTPSNAWFGALYSAASRSAFDDFGVMELERLIWGVAKMDPPLDAAPDTLSPGWIDAFLARCAVQMCEMSYCNLANVLFALAMLRVKPGSAWLVAAAARIEDLVEDFGQTTAAKVLWALPRLQSSSYEDDGGGATAGASDTEKARVVALVERLLEARVRRMVWRPRPRRG